MNETTEPTSANHPAFAILDIALVMFAIRPLLTWLTTAALPGLERWQTEVLLLPFPVHHHIWMIALPLTIIALRGQRSAEYGITFRNLRYHLDIAGTCFLPVVLSTLPFGLGLDYQRWPGALVLAAVQLGLLFTLGWLLRDKPGWRATSALAVGLVALPRLSHPAESAIAQALAQFVTYAVFVGFGEEVFYRGYIQSRLNASFGRPYRFFGTPFGWGGILAAFFFGLSHVGLLGYVFDPSAGLTWAWGFWTAFGGLVLGLVREKSGSIVAPALLHGLPQAIAVAAMILFSS